MLNESANDAVKSGLWLSSCLPWSDRAWGSCTINVRKAPASSVVLRVGCGCCRTHGRWSLLPSYPQNRIHGSALPNIPTRECNTSSVKPALHPCPGRLLLWRRADISPTSKAHHQRCTGGDQCFGTPGTLLLTVAGNSSFRHRMCFHLIYSLQKPI